HQARVRVGATGAFQVLDLDGGRLVDSRWSGESTVEAAGATVRYAGRQIARRLRVLPSGRGFVTLNGHPYRGVVDLVPDDRARFTAINRLDVDCYVAGVVNPEMGAGAPLEAKKAQAVASRTYALKNKGNFAAQGFDLRADEQSQMYLGVGAEDAEAI